MSVRVEQQPFPAPAGHCKADLHGVGYWIACFLHTGNTQETVDRGDIFVFIGRIYHRSDLKE